MAAQILMGSVLVLASWLFATLLVIALGRWAAVLSGAHRSEAVVLRASLWWGLAIGAIVILGLGLVVPLGGPFAGGGILALGVLLAGVGVALRPPRLPRVHRPSRGGALVIVALVLAIVYLAVKALGPVTNYDTGLYHLGAVAYAHDFSAIPGLANLFFPLGYANAQFPLAAALGNGPWDGQGYRLLNGLLIVLVTTDVVLRLLSRRHGWGTFVLVIGLSAVLVPLVAMADALVASPTSDTAVLLLTLASSAYLADLLQRRTAVLLEASVVLLTSALAVAMRPTMAVYALGVLIVVAVSLVRRPQARAGSRLRWVPVLVVVLTLAGLVVLRDRVLSGWLLYPLSIHAFDVPWLAEDPTIWRDATLAAARDPAAPDQYAVAHSWDWITAWIGRLPQQWEPWYVAVGLTVTIVCALVARSLAGFPRSPRRLLASVAPGGLAVTVWFVASPPSFRFIWGPLFSVLFLIVGAALHDLSRSGPPRVRSRVLDVLLAGCTVIVLAVTGYSAVARNQVDQITEERVWRLLALELPYAVAPPPLPAVTPVTMPSGLTVIIPVEGDQCWANYPLCTFNPRGDITQRGPSLQDGFARQ